MLGFQRDEVDGTVGCVGAPQGPARLTNDLDPFDTLKRRIVRTHLEVGYLIHSSMG